VLGCPNVLQLFLSVNNESEVIKTGFGFLETAIETQIEKTNEVPFLWLFGWKD